MSEWKEYKLGDVSTFSYGSMPKKEKLGIGLYPTYSGYKYQELYPECNCKKGDIIVVARGVGGTGDVKIVKQDAYLTNLSIKINLDKENVDNKFFYYTFLKENLRYLDSGSAQSQITITDLSKVLIPLPPLPEQKAIASVLSSLDDKIDLLQRQNKTLEGMAEALWRKMFIEDADDDWPVENLGNLFDIGIGRTPPRKEQHWFTTFPSDMKWVSIKDMGNCGIYIDSVSEYLTKDAVEKFNIPIIPNNTVLLSFKMTVGRLAITTEEMLSNEAIAHFKIKKQSYFNSEFLYFFLKNFRFESLGSTSSIVEAVNSQMIKEMEMFIPSENLITAFNNNVIQYFNKIKSNQEQITSLLYLRDSLLPKLMSGEVRVKI